MIEATDLTHVYDGKSVLRSAAFTLARREACLILGGSGSGKTTLLHILAGILKPTQGEVHINGTPIGTLSGGALDHFRGRHIGIVLQRFHLIGAITVLQNLMLAQTLAGQPADDAVAMRALETLAVAHRASAYPRELSHGQAQRVAIARAVINGPSVILADEPTSNLDDAHCAEALKLIRAQAQACDAALIIATHDSRIKSEIEKRIELAAPQ
jgi:ABC-type lipoprotein export system ATPase subunit